jgi:HPt (histidine-containing phosphotransfer) domain-containing protein
MHDKPVCDPAQVWEMVGNDPESFRSILEIFLAGLPESMDRIQVLAAEADRQALAREAHAMKGFATTLGAQTAAVLSQRLEAALERDDWEEIHGLLADLSQEVDAILALLHQMHQEQ